VAINKSTSAFSFSHLISLPWSSSRCVCSDATDPVITDSGSPAFFKVCCVAVAADELCLYKSLKRFRWVLMCLATSADVCEVYCVARSFKRLSSCWSSASASNPATLNIATSSELSSLIRFLSCPSPASPYIASNALS